MIWPICFLLLFAQSGRSAQSPTSHFLLHFQASLRIWGPDIALSVAIANCIRCGRNVIWLPQTRPKLTRYPLNFNLCTMLINVVDIHRTSADYLWNFRQILLRNRRDIDKIVTTHLIHRKSHFQAILEVNINTLVLRWQVTLGQTRHLIHEMIFQIVWNV